MPRNGEINNAFGVYKSLCCGDEIVISEGMKFPDCTNHRNLSTVWKPVEDERIRHITELFPKKKSDAA